MDYVYIIESESGAVKIGVSKDPQTRMSELQTSNPSRLVIRYLLSCPSRDAALASERLLHERYAHWSLSGEWFDISAQEIIADIDWNLRFANETISGTEYQRRTIVDEVRIIEYVQPYKLPRWMRRIAATYREFTGHLNRNTVRRTNTSSNQPTPAEMDVVNHLRSNPDDWNLSVRELGEAVGYSKTVASTGRNWALKMNGHGEK